MKREYTKLKEKQGPNHNQSKRKRNIFGQLKKSNNETLNLIINYQYFKYKLHFFIFQFLFLKSGIFTVFQSLI